MHNVETMAYAYRKGANDEAYQTPWHGLGVPVTADMTPEEMLKVAGLDWSVVRHPTFVKLGDREVYAGRDALVRSSDDRILTSITEGWEPVQNQMFVEFFDEFVREGHMEMNTMGSLQNGNIVWALAKVKESFSLFSGKDTIEAYLLFTNPHKYGQCVDVRFSGTRVVCNNTLNLALSKSSDMMVKLNHTRKFDPVLVKETLGISSSRLKTYREAAEFLATKRFDKDKLEEYYKTIFPTQSKEEPEKLSKPAKTAFDCIDTQPGAELGEGTWWQAFNSITFTVDHLLGRSDDTRLASAWYGPNRGKKVLALEKAVEFANAA